MKPIRVLALRLRRRRKPLRIDVLSCPDEAGCRRVVEGSPAAVSGFPQDRQPALRDVDPRLKVELDRGVLSVEYQVV